MNHFLVNGEVASSLTISDRAFQYGDGLFETIAVREGRLEYWQRHMQRLSLGCQRLNIPAPNVSQLLGEVLQLLSGLREAEQGIIKIIVSRGEGGRGYRAPSQVQPKRVVGFYSMPAYPVKYNQQGINLTVCKTPLGLNPALAGMKHLNRLEQVIGRSEWDDESIAEGLMLDIQGNVIEGTMTNLFFVRDGQLYTPALENSGVAGIMREAVLECCTLLNITSLCGSYPLQVLQDADELFVTNSIAGIWPVKQLQGNTYNVGPVTQQLQHALANHKQQQGEYETVH